MKSKKFVALALSAAMAFSVSYIGVAAISMRTASVSAANIEVKTGKLDYDERYATVKIKSGDMNNVYWDWRNKTTNYDDQVYGKCSNPVLTYKAVKKLLSNDGQSLPDYPSTNIKKFLGWSQNPNATEALKDTDDVKKDGIAISILESYEDATGSSPKIKSNFKTITLDTFYPVYVYYDSLKDQEDTLKAEADAAAEKKENDDRTSALNRRLWRQHAGDNVKYWYSEEVKDEAGKGTGKYVIKEGTKTAYPRAILVTGDDSKFTAKNYSGSKDKDGAEAGGEIYHRMGSMQYEAAINAARVQDPEHELVYVFDVHWSTADNILGLLEGKQAQVTLRLPNLTITNYTPYVYHITYGGKGMMRTAVKNLDVGKHDITFYAQSFSPYVLVLAPGKLERYENPPTADLSAIPTLLLGAAALSATGSTLLRRKRELGE